MMAKKNQSAKSLDQLAQLQEQLKQAQESERRALADYQNLVRRNQEERSQFVTFANKEVIKELLEPVMHLDLAAAQIDDQGLNMVVGQFWQKLAELGLEKIDVYGKSFDLETMEAVDKDGEGEVVIEVRRPGFRYQGQVIQHAQVVLGSKQ